MDTRCNDYKCTICYDIFIYPVCLPCKHRFCKLCFDKHIENNTMSCPICRLRVSNWLRQLRRSNGDVVDKLFWEKVQKLYPEEVKKRINGHVDYQSQLKYLRKRLSIVDDKEKAYCASLHKAFLDPRFLQDQEDDWLGWQEHVYQVCHHILKWTLDHPTIETSPTLNDTPRRQLAKQGEIHKEYEQFLQKELEEKKREDEENFRLSEAMIKMIEDEERREEEERRQQLLKDEELARRLEEEGAADSDKTPEEGGPKVQTTPRRRTRGVQKLHQDDTNSGLVPLSPGCRTPLCLGLTTSLDSPSTSKEMSRHCLNASTPSTSKATQSRCSQSPIHLDAQSTSKENVFAKFFTGNSSPSSSHTREKNSSQEETISIDSKTSLISNKELSHFASVQASPSNVINGPKSSKKKKKKKEVVPPSSRCSSGCDSIGQELNHFKPIRTSPTTPPKDGSKGLLPKLVVAQRGIKVPDLNIMPWSPLLDADVSLEELETSINLEKQLEEDRRLAMEIQNQFDKEGLPAKADYNLRKRKRPSGSIKKKVLLDRSQTTLDNMLIK